MGMTQGPDGDSFVQFDVADALQLMSQPCMRHVWSMEEPFLPTTANDNTRMTIRSAQQHRRPVMAQQSWRLTEFSAVMWAIAASPMSVRVRQP